MSEKMNQILKQRVLDRTKVSELKANGWISTGDVSFFLANKHSKMKQGTIDTHFRSFIEKTLKDKDVAYQNANLCKVGAKTFISPELLGEVEKHEKKYYGITEQE